MQNFKFSINPGKNFNVLCLGAHCDDIEIGCGGTLLKLMEEYENVRIMWVVFASNGVRKKEAYLSADFFLEHVQQKEVKIFDFKDGFLPSVWSEVKITFETLKNEFSPDIIFTHYRYDLHQDHRILNELTWNTYRNHLILEYEIPKYDGDMGNPNLFVPLEEYHVEQKKEILFNSFKSQLNKQWFDDSLLSSILRIRGMESVSESKYAEAFYCRKMTM